MATGRKTVPRGGPGKKADAPAAGGAEPAADENDNQSQDVQFDGTGDPIRVVVNVDNAPPAGNCRLFVRDPKTQKRFILTHDPEWRDLSGVLPVGVDVPLDVSRMDGLELKCEGSIAMGPDPHPDVRFDVWQGNKRIGRIVYPPETDEPTDAYVAFELTFTLGAS